MFIGPRTSQQTDLTAAFEELSFSGEFLASYAELLKSRSLAEKVVEQESLPTTATELRKKIETSIVTNTRIITVSVTDTDPDRVQRTVNALVDTFIDEDLKDFGGRAGVQANVLDPAIRPTTPIKPKPLQNGLIGAVLGLVLGLSIAFLLEQFDTTLRSREDVERALAPLPVLATIPAVPNVERDLLLDSNSKTPAAEAFRILRTNVQFFSVDRPVSKILVAGSGTEEGKTTVAMNLAAGFALGGVPTVFVESDLRRPVIHNYFNIRGTPGISDVLLGKATLEQALVKTRIPNLRVLPAGTPPPNPSELLGTKGIAEIIRHVEKDAEMIIFDSPPALAMSDAYVLAPLTDGVILVVRAGHTQREGVRASKEAFERLGARLLGLVWNAAEASDVNYYYRYYHHYSELEPSRRQGGRKKRSEPVLARPATAEPISWEPVALEAKVEPAEQAPEEVELRAPSNDLAAKLQPAEPDDGNEELEQLSPRNLLAEPPVEVEEEFDLLAPRNDLDTKDFLEALRTPNKELEEAPVPSTPPDRKYEGYCVNCRINREFVGEETLLYGGLRSAEGPCPVCKGTIRRRLTHQVPSPE